MGILGKGVIGSVAFALGFYTAVQHMASKYDYNPNKCDQYLEERLEQVKKELFPEFYLPQGGKGQQALPQHQTPYPQQQQQPYQQQQAPSPQTPQQQLQQQLQLQRKTPLDHLEGLMDSLIDLLDAEGQRQLR